MNVKEYLKEFENLRISICKNISQIFIQTGEEKLNTIRKTNKEIILAQELISSLELSSFSETSQTTIQLRIKEYKDDISLWKIQLETAQSNKLKREEFFSELKNNSTENSRKTIKEKAQSINQIQSNNTLIIKEIHNSLDESFSLCVDIMDTLYEQDKQIDTSREKLRKMNQRLSNTRRKINQLY